MDDIERFTEGDCHYLALAIHRLTGWKCYAFDDGDGKPTTHAFVIDDDGYAVDVEGVWNLDDFMHNWGESKIIPVTDNYETDWEPADYEGTTKRVEEVAQAICYGTYHSDCNDASQTTELA